MPSRWPNPELSAGDFLPQHNEHLRTSCWEAIGGVRDTFKKADKDVRDHLKNYSREVTHRAIWSVYMIGHTKETSDPVIMFWCIRPKCKPRCGKKAMHVVEKGKVMLKYPGFQLGHCKWSLGFDQLPLDFAGSAARELSIGHIIRASNLFFGLEGLEYPTLGTLLRERSGHFWIRVLCIKSGEPGDPLRTYLTHVPERPNSGIASYAWIGENSEERKLMEIGEKHFQVPVDLWDALETLRLGDQDIYIWLDVLCIDPDNEDEVKHPYVSIRHRSSEDPTRQNPVLGIQGWVHNLKGTQQTPPGNAPRPLQILTLGGLVQLDGKYFCLAAAHAFEAANDLSDESSSVGENDFEWNVGEDESQEHLGIDPVDSTSRGSTTPEQQNAASTETINSLKSPSVTPPARVEEPPDEPNPTPLDVYKEEVTFLPAEPASFQSELREVIGPLAISSLENNASSDLDYALISVSSPFQFASLLASGEFKGNDSGGPQKVALAMPNYSCKVIAYSGSLGPIEGTISATPAVMYNPSNNSRPFQELWTVRLNGKLSMGDSGTWVVEADSGDLLGHIISGRPDSGLAYIIPMIDIFEDISASSTKDLQILDNTKFIDYYTSKDQGEISRNLGDLVLSSTISSGQGDIILPEPRPVDPVPLSKGTKEVRPLAPSEGHYIRRQSSDDRVQILERPIRRDKSPTRSRHPIRTRVRSTLLGMEETVRSYGLEENANIRGRYKYKPLARGDDIRIFRLFPGQDGDRIEGALFPAAMTTIHYDAVSYVWGSPDVKHEILVSSIAWGRRKEKINEMNPASLYIRSNLFTTLQALRDPERDIYLWIDAICLDCDNKEELNMQSSGPPEIFRNAESVLLWLGNPSTIDLSEDAFDFVTNRVCDMFNFDNLLGVGGYENRDWADDWFRLALVMKDSVFSRRWIIREIAFANKVILYSGKNSLAWDDFADAVALFTTNFDYIKKCPLWKKLMEETREPFEDISRLPVSILVNTLPKLFQKDNTGKIVGYNLPLEELMLAFSPFQTSDARDNIYALLSIARDTDRRSNIDEKYESSASISPYHSVKPRYDRDLVEACTQLVQSSVERTKSVDILCRHWAPDRMTILHPNFREQAKTLDLPSWMPTVAGGAFSRPWATSTQRSSGDSLVGPPGRPIYRASASILANHADAVFGSKIQGSVKTAWILEKRLETIRDRSRARVKIPQIGDDSEKARFYEEVQSTYVRDRPISSSDPSTKSHSNPRSGGEWIGRWYRAFDSIVEELYLRRVSNNDNPLLNIVNVVIGRIRRRKSATALRVQGIFLSVADSVTSRCINGSISEEALRLGGWIPSSERIIDGDDAIPKHLWQTLVAGRDRTGETSPDWYRRAFEYILELAKTGFMRDIETNTLVETCKSSPIVDFLQRMRDVVWNRRLFTIANKNWNLGLGPPQMQVGDLVCVIFGCSVPVVLREIIDSQGIRFKLIGECYVHGLMDGEAIEWAKSAKRANLWFPLV